jgi:hypothetical protein
MTGWTRCVTGNVSPVSGRALERPRPILVLRWLPPAAYFSPQCETPLCSREAFELSSCRHGARLGERRLMKGLVPSRTGVRDQTLSAPPCSNGSCRIVSGLHFPCHGVRSGPCGADGCPRGNRGGNHGRSGRTVRGEGGFLCEAPKAEVRALKGKQRCRIS